MKIITSPNQVTFNYQIPSHLEGISDMSLVRDADLTLLNDELKQRGSDVESKKEGKIIWRLGFPNMVLDATNVYMYEGGVCMDVVPIHPHRADLAFKGDKSLKRNVYPVTVNSILVDSEGNKILGVRGGNVAQGKLGVIPGGHAEYNSKNPERSAFVHLLAEFEEELDFPYEKSELESPIVGVFDNRDINGINVLYVTKINKSYEEISQSQKFAKDSYEHEKLLKLGRSHLEELAGTGKLNLGSKGYETTPFFQD